MSTYYWQNSSVRRRGAALVLVVLCLVPLMAVVALAIDLGLLAVARTECQDAADAAAMAGARTLNGDRSNNNNYGQVGPSATATMTGRKILNSPMTSNQLGFRIGRYAYNSSTTRFEGQFPGPTNENWSLVQANVAADIGGKMGFSRIFGFTLPNIQTTSTAVHRPRDVSIILDFSGSMRFSSLLGTPYSGNRVSNNGDTEIPLFGHYSATSSAALAASSFTLPYAEANLTHTTSDGRAPIVGDFYLDAGGTPAFTAAASSKGTTPGGDNFLRANHNSGAAYAATAASVCNIASGSVTTATRDATFESLGYTAWAMSPSFAGYTEGPGYWGKSFFVWPPDPRPAHDWRKKYFTYPGTSTGIDDNNRLWNNTGNWRTPGSTTYSINYNAILTWIKQAPCPFPSELRSGRIVYYTAIPNSINTGSFPPTNLNERFWKDYIDHTLGVMQTGSSSWTLLCGGSTGWTGYGADYAWGTTAIRAASTLTGSPKPYMHYLDNPRRPKLHFWFGPLSMVDFLGNYNGWINVSPAGSRFAWWPGTCHESPLYGCKLGVRAALNDMDNNHPNDLAAMIFFSVPATSATNSASGRFNRARVGLGRDYSAMQEYLWYPPSTVGSSSATVTPYDANNLEAPRAFGGTCYSMPLMLAFNQFSGNTSLQTYNPGAPAGDAGGNGRRGAQKIIIFETDGAPNTTADAGFVSGSAHQSYYQVRFNSVTQAASDFPFGVSGYSNNDPTVVSEIQSVCQRLCDLESAGGFSTPSKPVLIHCIGFGYEFSPSSPNQAVNIATLNSMQQIGSVTDGMPTYKLVYGDESTVIANLQEAFTNILQTGVQVSLIQ